MNNTDWTDARREALDRVTSLRERLDEAEHHRLPEADQLRADLLAATVAYDVAYHGRDPLDESLPETFAAGFVGRIINRCFLVENHVACGYATEEELAFWRQQFKYADRAFDVVYGGGAEIEPEDEIEEPLRWEPIEEDDHVMTRRAFERAVEDGSLIDYDGWGEYADRKRGEKTNKRVSPSDLEKGGFDPAYTHVVWYNR